MTTNIQIIQQGMQWLPCPGTLQRVVICADGQCEPIGNLNVLRAEFPIKLTKRRILPTDQRNVLKSNALEPSKII